MRTLSWLTLGAAAITSAVLVGLPVWLVQPFSAQTPGALAWSHAFKQIAPWFTAVAVAISCVCAAVLWRPSRVQPGPPSRRRSAVRRGALFVCVSTIAGAAWFSRQNHFEWMFRPNTDAVFVAIGEASDVEAGEPVIGVTIGGDALAFPVTRIGYHHLVNTTIARKPIVATY